MESIIYQINKELDSFFVNTYRRKSFNRDHIFYNVLEILKQKVDEASRLNVIYVFSEIEKAVLLLKKKSELSNIQVLKVDRLYEKLNLSLREYMGVSYHPMKALEYYNSKNFEKAIEELDCFFKKSHEVLGNSGETFIYANTEQYLNLFRIYSDKACDENVIDMSCGILLFCYYNVSYIYNKIKFVYSEIDIFDNDEIIYWRVYVTNCIFRKLIIAKKYDIIEKIVNKVCETFLINTNKNDYFKNSILSIFYFYKKDFDNSLLYFKESLNFFNQYSEILLYLNLKNTKCIFDFQMKQNNGKELQKFNEIYENYIKIRLKNILTFK